MKWVVVCRRMLIAVAVAFVLSAWLYSLATIRALQAASEPRAGQPSAGLLAFFRDNGTWVLAMELAGLAVMAAVLVVLERRLGSDGRPD